MKRYKGYAEAEKELLLKIIKTPQFITSSTFEVLNEGFILTDPTTNINDRSNYDYADKFFRWMMTGAKELSKELIDANPWVKRFVEKTGLPESFSATYGWKIHAQIDPVLAELKRNHESRRAYFNILLPDDKIILGIQTTHEYPCTVGVQIFIRDERLHMMVNMRSNNVYSVMPYDVYNFTMLQQHIANELKMDLGEYHHQINSAHIYKGDVRRLKEKFFIK